MTHLIRMPGDTFSSDPHEYLTQTSSVCWERWRAKLCHSFTTRRRRTYLYFWISSREGSVWNLIHKHYSPDSPVFPLPEEKKASSSSEPLWGTFPQHSPPSGGSIRGLTGIWLPPCFIKHTCLQPLQVSVTRLLVNSSFLRLPQLSTGTEILNKPRTSLKNLLLNYQEDMAHDLLMLIQNH